MSNFVLPSESQLLQKAEVHFTSYEDIKTSVRQHIEANGSEFTPKAVCKELPDAFIVEGRMNYVIKPISSTIFEVSSYFPKTPCRYGCTYWNYMEFLHDLLCEHLNIKYEIELKKHKLTEDYLEHDNEEETTGLEGESPGLVRKNIAEQEDNERLLEIQEAEDAAADEESRAQAEQIAAENEYYEKQIADIDRYYDSKDYGPKYSDDKYN